MISPKHLLPGDGVTESTSIHVLGRNFEGLTHFADSIACLIVLESTTEGDTAVATLSGVVDLASENGPLSTVRC